MGQFLIELRRGVRRLLGSPGFALTAVGVLALGIGANAAVFSLVNALLLKPLAGEPERLVGLYNRERARPDRYRAFSYPDFREIRASGLLEDVAAQSFAMVGLGEGQQTRRSFAGLVSAGYFETLGVKVALGRGFSEAEERPGGDVAVTVISDALWRRSGADPTLVGRTLRVNARDFTVIGVAPRGFTGTSAVISPELWLPLGVFDSVANDFVREPGDGRLAERRVHTLILAGRLRAGEAAEALAPRLAALSDRLATADPGANGEHEVVVDALPRLGMSTSPRDEAGLGGVAALALALAGTVLLVACLNLANMLLARGASRRKEVAIRMALGAGRARLVGELLGEGLLLSLAGGAVGLGLAAWMTRLVGASLEPLLPLALSLDPVPDARVLAATLAFSLLCVLLFALAPAWRLTRGDLLPDLKDQAGELRAARGRGWSLSRSGLVVAQLALSLTLVAAGGLFVRGALRAAAADPGFRLEGGLVVGLDPSLAGRSEAEGRRLYEQVLDSVRGLSGVEAASLASLVPFGDITESETVRRAGRAAVADTDAAGANAVHTIVSADYFRSLGLGPLRGREFSAADERSAAGLPAALVNEPLARALFPDGEPIGQLIEVGEREDGREPRAYEIVGVVPGLRHALLDHAATPQVYVPLGSRYRASLTLHVRTRPGEEVALLRRVRDTVDRVDPSLPVLQSRTLIAHRDANIILWVVRAAARLFTSLGLVAALLAAVGLYGVKAYLVSRRRREIGIRMALGASSADVRRQFLLEGLRLAGVGLALGLPLAAALASLLGGLLYEVSPFDPLVFAAAPSLLLGVALLASWLPARQAAAVSPATALRD